MNQIYKNRLFFTVVLMLLSWSSFATINASFTFTYVTGRCGASLVSFTNTSTSSAPLTVTNLFYGTGFSTTTFASHLYNVGTYCPILAIQNSLGERDTFRASPCVQVFANPIVNLDIDSSRNCNGLVCINNLTNPGAGCTISSVIYDAPGSIEGLVSLSSAARQCFNYPAVGDYSLTVRVTNSCGCVATVALIDTIHYLSPPVASFTSGPSVGCGTSLSVAFTNTSVGATSYFWRYQRTAPTVGPVVTFSTAVDPTQVFPAGTYDVTLVAVNAAGCRDSITATSYVDVSSSPTIDFTLVSTAALCGSTNVTFRPTTPEVGTYEWTITPVGGASPSTGSSYDFTTTITATTTYTVTVIQTLPGGCTATRTRTFPITVFLPPGGSYAYTGACHERCKPADTIIFTTIGLTCPSGPCSLSWSFPGAVAPTTRTGPGPHTAIYNTFGSNNFPTLTITDTRGCSSTFTAPGQIRIVDYTNAISIGAREGCIPLAVPFADLTTVNACDSVVSRQWSFGSAGTSTAKFPIVNFTVPGCYPVQLITTTRIGCTDTLRLDSVVCCADTPIVSFIATPDTMCFEDTAVLFTLTGAVDSIRWVDFGDGGRRSTLTDTTSYFYTDTGVFYPSVMGFLHGCPSRLTLSDTVFILYPIANFRDSTFCGNRFQKFFINTSVGLDSVGSADSVFWDFGNLASVTDTSSRRNPNYIFPDTGCYSVMLTIWSRTTGCDHSVTRNICVRRPTIDFIASTRDTCLGSVIRFTNTSSSIRSGNSTRFYNTGAWGAFGPIAQVKTYNRTCLDTVRMINIATDGCRDTIVKPNFINIRSVTAKITARDTAGCSPLTTTFSDTASRLICAGTKRVLWDFGDPSTTLDTSTASNPTYTYRNAGTYTVTALVFDDKCLAVSNSIRVVVFNPIANFTVDTLHCVNNGPLTVTNLSSALFPRYNWSFPGAVPASSTLANPPAITYSTPGVYNITLTVTDSLGCDSVLVKPVRIYEPIANFGVADSYFVCDGGLITFFDSSFTNICSWTWDFGDGTGSTLRNPAHLYAQPGNYTVTLVVQSCDGCYDTMVRNSFIVIKGPNGSFTFAPSLVCVNNSVRTIIQSRNASQVYYLTGDNLILINHSTTIPQDSLVFDTVNYVYSDTGVFFPQLLLADSSGCNIPYTPGFSVTVDSLVTKFGFTRLNLCDTATLCFYDSSLYIVRRIRPTFYDWDFGDGTPHSAFTNPCHKYNAPGNYRVRLYVNNPAGGCGDSIVTIIRIPFKPRANFSRSDSFQCVNDPLVSFTDLSTRGDTQITRWNWQFRPLASTSSLQNPNFDFTAAGTYNVLLTITDSLGCTDSISKPVYIVADPIADAGRDTTICFGTSTRLTGSGGRTYSWSPATFLSATNISNPLCTPDSTTMYILTTTDSAGCSDVDTVLISVSRVFANYRNDTVCFGVASTFTNLSTTQLGSLTGYAWNFGDVPSGAANTSILASPTHTFTSITAFSVRLVTTNSFGCTDDTTMSVPLLQSPVSNFTATTACVRDSTIFGDLSSTTAGSIVSWRWDFGDVGAADTSLLANPRWVYSAAGTYTVRLTVRNQGCSKDTTISVTVLGRPVANFRMDTTCIYNPVAFTDLSTSGRGIRNWSWNFGDTSITSDSSNAINPVYTYPSTAPSNYSTRLLVIDSNGCSDDTFRTTTIVPLPVARFIGDTLCPGDTLSFTDLSTSLVGPIGRWHWDFGDATSTVDTSNLRNPRFSYSIPGIYNVQLTTYSRYGCVDDTIVAVFVQAPVLADFIADSVCLGDSMQFTDTSIPLAGSVVAWNWTFGSPPNSTLQNPAYLFTTAGSRLVNLRVTSSIGCSDDTSKMVYVFANPIARFVADSVCLGDSNHMTSLSASFSFPIVSYNWNLTASDSATGSSASYLYPTGGFQPVTLTVVDGFGCTDDTTMNVTTYTLPTANFTFSGGCGALPVNFSNTSLPGSGGAISSFFWNFDDGGITSTLSSPSHSYTDSSAHNVLFIVTDIRGCFDSIVRPVSASIIPNARFTVSPDVEVCLGVPICFNDLSTWVSSRIATYAWDVNGDLLTDYSVPSICHTYTVSGNYRVTFTVTDSIGCQDTASINVRINQPPIANFLWDTTCENTPMIFTDVSIAGSGVINDWNWSFGDASGDIIQNPTHAYSDSGAYPVRLMIEDDNGCRDTADKVVLVDWQSNVSAFSDTSVCLGNSVILHGEGAAIYEWTPSLYLNRDDTSYVVSTPLTSLNYTVLGYGPYRACPPTSQQITVQVLPPMPLNTTANPTVIILGSTSQLTAFPAGSIDSIRWTPNPTLTCDDCIDPIAEPPVSTDYVATIYYSLLDAYCNTSDTVTVTVIDQCPKEIFFMPNTFTPNGDGQNDIFYPRGYGVKDVAIFRVFDRWGNLVHERTNIKANDKNFGWLGMDKSGSKQMNPGVYVYYIEATCTNDDKISFSGNVTLIR